MLLITLCRLYEGSFTLLESQRNGQYDAKRYNICASAKLLKRCENLRLLFTNVVGFVRLLYVYVWLGADVC